MVPYREEPMSYSRTLSIFAPLISLSWAAIGTAETGVRDDKVILYRRRHTGPSVPIPRRNLGLLLRRHFSFRPGVEVVVADGDRGRVPREVADHYRLAPPLPGETPMRPSILDTVVSRSRLFGSHQEPAVYLMLGQLKREVAPYAAESRMGATAVGQQLDSIVAAMRLLQHGRHGAYQQVQGILRVLSHSELVRDHDKQLSDAVGKRPIAELLAVVQDTMSTPDRLPARMCADLGSLVYLARSPNGFGVGAFAEREIPMGTLLQYGGRLVDVSTGAGEWRYRQLIPAMFYSDPPGPPPNYYAVDAAMQGNEAGFINHGQANNQLLPMPVVRGGLPLAAYWAMAPIPQSAQLLVPYELPETQSYTRRGFALREATPFEHLGGRRPDAPSTIQLGMGD